MSLLGRFVLGERLSRLQWTAVAIAAAGVSVLAAGALGQLWISLTLCVSFALYGLLRKVVAADARHRACDRDRDPPSRSPWRGWSWSASPAIRCSDRPQFDAQLLLLAGIATTTPLLLFTAAARRLPYSTLGMLQFLAPTLQFLLAVLLYGEPFTLAHAIAFASDLDRACALRHLICYARRGCRRRPNDARSTSMLNIISIIIGLVALLFAVVAFIPLLGWANWLIIPLAILGAALGMASRGTAGRNLNLFVIVVGVVRLILGGGLL